MLPWHRPAKSLLWTMQGEHKQLGPSVECQAQQPGQAAQPQHLQGPAADLLTVIERWQTCSVLVGLHPDQVLP